MRTRPNRGFSLVELSIVLVILGLLVGGVLAGKSLIRASEMRNVSTEHARYVTAVLAFKDRYFHLPGDMPNATSFWGTSAACTPVGGVDRNPGTCNGNGNGFIMDISTPYGGPGLTYFGTEQFLAWQHLALAGLIEGRYTGNAGAGHFYQDANNGINVPLSKVSGGSWCFLLSSGWVFTNNYANSLSIGDSSLADAVGACHRYIFLPEEAWNIDTKMDDGMPARGKVIAFPSHRCTNAWTDINNFDALYSITGPEAPIKNCNLAFVKGF